MLPVTNEILKASKLFSPLLSDLYAGAKDSIKSRLRKWTSDQQLKNIVTRIASVENVRTFWQLDKEIPIRDFYFPLSIIEDNFSSKTIPNERELSHVSIKKEGNHKIVSSLAELKHSRCVIEGTVGQGKSIFMRFLCTQELSQESCKRMPLFIEMRSITPRLGLIGRILDELKNYGVEADEEIFDYLCESGKLALLLDGYDELSPDPMGQVFSELGSLSRRFPELQIVVSSRPDTDAQKLPSFPVIKLAPLHPSTYIPFLQKLGLTRARATEIASAINESPTQIASLITTPLTLTLTVLVYNFESKIPPELDEFYEALFTTVISRHDKSKPGFTREFETKLGERGLRKLFEAFCFMSAQKELTRTLSVGQFAAAFERAITYSDVADCSLESFRSDICKVACLMQEEGLGDVTYLHKSIAEYFSASFVCRQQQSAAAKFYNTALQDDRIWKGVLYFLAKVDSYRFNALYLIPLIDLSFEIMQINLQNPTDESIEQFISKIANSPVTFNLGYRKGAELHFPANLLENKTKNGFVVDALFRAVVRAVHERLPGDLSLLEGYDEYRSFDTDGSIREVPGRLAFEFVGIRHLVMPFKIAMARFQSMYANAKSCNAREETKQDIF
ncbi:NACHT domain-containing protein [Paraburkholderia fungorum]|uniref:NACHT domain-containing protein n=1 Tax=Paraburkholderia fungorum TaxID=134537 RepID=UPI003877AB4F